MPWRRREVAEHEHGPPTDTKESKRRRVGTLRAVTGGTSVAVDARGGSIWPGSRLAQGEVVHAEAEVSSPRWRDWLLGGTITANARVRFPKLAIGDLVTASN